MTIAQAYTLNKSIKQGTTKYTQSNTKSLKLIIILHNCMSEVSCAVNVHDCAKGISTDVKNVVICSRDELTCATKGHG